MDNVLKSDIGRLLQQKLPEQIQSIEFKPVSGGSINDTFKICVDQRHYFFLKLNSSPDNPGLFQKERSGLDFLRQQKIIRVPETVEQEENGAGQILILEWIETGKRTENFWQCFGEQLAQLHKVTNPEFGFRQDNYMGALPQVNTPANKWTDFFANSRIAPQVSLAVEKKLLHVSHISLFEKLNKKLGEFFEEEEACLLHGDLWNGNFMCDINSQPVLIDPAVYFGHRSIDLGMTTLFGGFDERFYDAYNFYFPFPPGHKQQWDICNLYPLLVHLNLFGTRYLGQIIASLRKYA